MWYKRSSTCLRVCCLSSSRHPSKHWNGQTFFEEVTAIRQGVVNLFYKGYINTEKHYAIVKWKKVNFESEAINGLYMVEQTVVGHAIIKEPSDPDKTRRVRNGCLAKNQVGHHTNQKVPALSSQFEHYSQYVVSDSWCSLPLRMLHLYRYKYLIFLKTVKKITSWFL